MRGRFELLPRFVAQHDEYLKLRLKDGKVEHREGPCNEILNPQVYESIDVCKSICLSANQVVVVYTNEKSGNECARKIVKGPKIYVPEPNEW